MNRQLGDDDRGALLTLARHSIEAAVRRAGAPACDGQAVFDRHAGAFVTLTRGEVLRGCVGRVEPHRLGDVISHCAVAAALEDPRFPPVSPLDLAGIAIAISVLSAPMAVEDPALVAVGRHGVIVEQGGRRGLLLPQVAIEWGWTRDELLSHTCRKAGLAPDAWRAGARIFTFEAEVFHESPLGG
jgi:AmmeMemoRadiSam system protein A